MSVGAWPRTRWTSVWMPATSLAIVQRSPDGRIAMTNSAFATSMPTNAGAVDDIGEPPRDGRLKQARSCVMRDGTRATVRALSLGRATPTLTLGLADRRRIELSPATVRRWLTLPMLV